MFLQKHPFKYTFFATLIFDVMLSIIVDDDELSLLFVSLGLSVVVDIDNGFVVDDDDDVLFCEEEFVIFNLFIAQ